ncbi:MAG: TolC family protein [Rhodospirillaceae bacterium]
MIPRIALALALGLCCAVSQPRPATAEDYRVALSNLIDTHKRVLAAKADVAAAKAAAAKARSAYYPDLTLTTSAGRQRMSFNNTTPTTDLPTRELTFGLRQTLWDFGTTRTTVDKADIGIRQSEAALAQTTQDLALEALTAYVNLERARLTEGFARQSVANITKQTGMEQSRVVMGGGFTSDVLQSKSQLAGAEARLVRAKGQLISAHNRFRALFGRNPDADDLRQHVAVPVDLLPTDLDGAIEHGRKNNRQLEVLRLSTDSARTEIDRVRGTELYPKINAIAQRKWDRNPDGVSADRTQHIFKVEMSYQFNAGLGSFDAIEAARQAYVSVDNKYIELRDLVEEQVRNAWQNLDTARENARHLQNQVQISGEFLRLAGEERRLGRRTLIEVLSGETSLINAQSDAASAEADVTIAAFTLLRSSGLLDTVLLK